LSVTKPSITGAQRKEECTLLIIKCNIPGCEGTVTLNGRALGNNAEIKCPGCSSKMVSSELFNALLGLSKHEHDDDQRGFHIKYEGDFE